MSSKRKRHVHTGPEADGEIDFFNTMLWGGPNQTVIMENGKVNFHQAHFFKYGTGIRIFKGEINLYNSHFHLRKKVNKKEDKEYKKSITYIGDYDKNFLIQRIKTPTKR